MESLHTRLPGLGWYRQMRVRALTWWPAKLLGTTLGMTGFFVVYFLVLNYPAYPVTTMPLIAPDRWIGFWPGALPLYVSLWLYVSLAPALIIERRELVALGLAALGMSLVGLGIFYRWPTLVPPVAIDWTQHPGLAFLKSADAAGNACPSLHVAFAVFTASTLARLLVQSGASRAIRCLNLLWCVGIVYSTMAIRQHVALDVIAGVGLGGIVAWMYRWWLQRVPTDVG
jgi:membrane-associated phospholipid phosphatase